MSNRAAAKLATQERLLGDRIAAGLQKIGADRVVTAVSRMTGKPCRCAERTAALNRWDAKWRGH